MPFVVFSRSQKGLKRSPILLKVGLILAISKMFLPNLFLKPLPTNHTSYLLPKDYFNWYFMSFFHLINTIIYSLILLNNYSFLIVFYGLYNIFFFTIFVFIFYSNYNTWFFCRSKYLVQTISTIATYIDLIGCMSYIRINTIYNIQDIV